MIEESIDTRPAHASRGRRAAGRVPRAPDRGPRAGRRDRRPRPQGRRGRRARGARGREGDARSCWSRPSRDIQAETQRAIQEIRREVADLTVAGDREGHPQDAQRGRPDVGSSRRRCPSSTSAPSPATGGTRSAMEEIAQVYARALFEVAKEHGKLDDVREQLGQFTDALEQNRDLAGRSSSRPTSRRRRRSRACAGRSRAPTRPFVNFLETAARAPPHAGDLPHPRASTSGSGTRRTSCCPSRSPARSTLDEATVKSIGDRIGEQTGQRVELTSKVDPTILGGIVLRVGNSDPRRLDQATAWTNFASTSRRRNRARPRSQRTRPCRSSPTRSPPF